jgi:ligand-binding sensor domain-containing protein
LPSGSPATLALDAGGKVHVGLQRGGIFVSDAGRFDRLGGSGADVQDFVSSLCIGPNGTVWAGTLGGGLYGLRNGQTIRLTTANGLADDAVLALCADASGNIWSSTSAGTVHRFDGKILTRFDAADGLTGSPVTAIIRAGSGGLWLGTRDGFILRGNEGKFSIAEKSGLTGHDAIMTLHESERGRLWIGTAGGGLLCLETNASHHWNLANGLPANTVAGVVEDAAKNIWLATSAGIYRVNHDAVEKALNDSASPLVCKMMSDAKTVSESASFTGGTRALLSPDGKLWFATSEGVLTVDTDQPEFATTTFPLYIESVAFNGQHPFSLLHTNSLSKTNPVPMDAPADIR